MFPLKLGHGHQNKTYMFSLPTSNNVSRQVLVNIHPLVQKIRHGTLNLDISLCRGDPEIKARSKI